MPWQSTPLAVPLRLLAQLVMASFRPLAGVDVRLILAPWGLPLARRAQGNACPAEECLESDDGCFRSERSLVGPASGVMARGRHRTACVVCRRGWCRRRAVLRSRARRSSPGVPARERYRAVAAGRRRDGCARDPWAGRLAGNRDRRPAGRRLLDAVGNGAGPDGRQHARGHRRRRSVPSAGRAAHRARTGLGCARARLLCRCRDPDQRGLRRSVPAGSAT